MFFNVGLGFLNLVQGSYSLSFENSMTFDDLFHNLSEFSMTKVKHLFSQ